MKNVIIATAIGAAMLVPGQAAFADGKATFDTVCFACHATGAAGAPKMGDKAAWAPRIAQGLDTLKSHAINGFSSTVDGMTLVMPAKGGRVDLADDVIAEAVVYMVDNSK